MSFRGQVVVTREVSEMAKVEVEKPFGGTSCLLQLIGLVLFFGGFPLLAKGVGATVVVSLTGVLLIVWGGKFARPVYSCSECTAAVRKKTAKKCPSCGEEFT
jgi:hypothetical protein